MQPRYPVYVISKGRWEPRQTSRALDRMGIHHFLVVEPQEVEAYQAVAPATAAVLVLPFSNLGQGSIPARNWVWEDSRARGALRHWILDDNIQNCYRLHENRKHAVLDGAFFRAMEDFTDRYENLALAGPQYEFFAPRKSAHPAVHFNTRVYSCILIQNSLPFRWRGRYNEDTDLSLRVLKAGLCTALFNAFLAKKVRTMVMRGGNTDSLYRLPDGQDGRLLMAQSLQAQHPDVVTVTRKWNRWQHQVDYRPFSRNALRKRAGLEIPEGVNDFGMVLRDLKDVPAST
jgi:hypothetical protein